MSNHAKRAAELLDPTALEQSGLDPQQVQKELDAAVRQAVSQDQTTPPPTSTSSSSTPSPPSASGSSSASAPAAPSYNAALDAAAPPPQTSNKPEFWKLDPTYLEQSGLDPQQVQKSINTAVKSQQQSSAPPQTSASSTSASGAGAASADAGHSRQTILDIVYKLDPTTSDPSSVDNFYSIMKNLQLTVWTSGGGSKDIGETKDIDYTKGRGLWSASSPSAPPSNDSRTAPISPDYLLDQRNPVNVVNRLTTAYEYLKSQLDKTVSEYSDVLAYSGNTIGMSPQLQSLLDRYDKALDELKKSLPDVEKALKDKFGDYVTVSGGLVDLAPGVKALVDRANEFALLYNNIQENYGSALFDLMKRYNLKVENNTLVFDFDRVKPELDEVRREYGRRVEELIRKYNLQRDEEGRLVADPSVLDKVRAELEAINRWYGSALNNVLSKYNLKVTDDGYIVFDYDKVKAELDAINEKRNKALEELYNQYSDLFNKRVVDGKVVYELRPEVQAAVALQDQLKQTVAEIAAAQQQTLQNVLSKYGDVLAYDPKTGKVAPSKELEEMLNRYSQAMQEVDKLAGAINTVAGMLPTFAQQLPVATVKFQTFDKSQGKFVETGGETPIYVKDESLRKEIVDWMSQNKDKLEVVALHDPNSRGRPYVVYVFNKETKEGYVIDPVEGTGFHVKGTEEGRVLDPATGKWVQLRGIELYIRDKSLDIWNKSLTDKEKKELEKWLEVRQRAAEIEQMHPAARELYSALLGAGRFAVITPAIDVLSRWLRGEDPTKGLEKFEIEAAAAAEASPLAHSIGQAVGFAGVAGLTAEALIAKGATLGASGIGKQFLTGLKSTLKPTIIGATTGATFGAVEGALTGRDPLAEAAKFGSIGLLTGLGGVPRPQLIAGGLLGGVVGASTAKEYGVEKGLEAGSTAFFLPIVAPIERGIGGIAMETAVARRPRSAGTASLKGESIPAVETRYTQIVRGLASQVRSRMEAKPEPGLTPDDVVAIATQLRFKPAEQRGFFQALVEDAVTKIRGGGDADVVLAQLSLIRQKLDPVSRMRFDEILRQFGLLEVKLNVPEYQLTEESATALRRFLKTRTPEYALTDKSARLLDHFLRPRQEPQYALTDAAAQNLNLFLKTRTPEYALTDETAQRLNQFLKMQRKPEYALTDEMAARLDQFLRMEQVPVGKAVAELASQEAARLKPRYTLTSKTVVELTKPELTGKAGLEPVLTGRAEFEVAPRQEPRPVATAKAEVQLAPRQEPRVEISSLLKLPEVQKSALEYALRPRAEAVTEVTRIPEVQQLLRQAQEIGRKLLEINEVLRTAPLTLLRLNKVEIPKKEWGPETPPGGGGEPPDRERRPAIPILPILQIEPPRDTKPPYKVPEISGYEFQYEPPLLTTTTPPPAAEVPPPPSYTPPMVPQIEVPPPPSYTPITPTYTPVPTYNVTPVDTYQVDIPPPKDVPTYDTVPVPPPLPHGWWRLLPPSAVAGGSEGAYRVQAGRKQILALA